MNCVSTRHILQAEYRYPRLGDTGRLGRWRALSVPGQKFRATSTCS